MTAPEFPDLRPLALDDHAMLTENLGRVASATCDLIPANLFIWRDCETPLLTRIGDCLCILVEPHSEPAYFLEPFGGSRRVDAVRISLTRADRVSRAARSLIDELPPQEFQIHPVRDHFDYIYLTQALVELKGKKFDGKRNQIRRFAGSCPDHEFLPLHFSQFDSAMALFGRWTEQRGGAAAPGGSPYSFSRECQRRALERAFEDYERLGLVGGAMIVRGELQGFIIASISAGTAVVHFQYANAEIPGIYQALLREACHRLFAGRAYVNLEEDLGVPGLRKTKLSYRPLRLEEKYEIRKLGA